MFNIFKKGSKSDKLLRAAIANPKDTVPTQEKSSQILLKEATAKNKAGDIDTAIMLLRKAYAVMKENGEN